MNQYKCVKTGCFIRVETEGDVCFRCKEVQAKKLDRQSKLERGVTRALEQVAGYGADRGARLVPVRGKSRIDCPKCIRLGRTVCGCTFSA